MAKMTMMMMSSLRLVTTTPGGGKPGLADPIAVGE